MFDYIELIVKANIHATSTQTETEILQSVKIDIALSGEVSESASRASKIGKPVSKTKCLSN